MVTSADDLKDILDRVDEYVDETRDGMREALGGKPLGAEAATDEEFMAFFASKMQENPNWVLALAFVDGGLEQIARFERLSLRGRMMGAGDGQSLG